MVVRGTTDGECLVAVGRERVARVGGDVDHALVAEGRHGRSVPIKRTFYFLVRREIVVISRRAHHVQRVLHLRDHLAPQLDGTAGVHGGDVADDVVLRGLDCRFRRIGVVMVRFDVLSCGALDFQEVLDSAGAFIVQDVEFGLVADRLEFCVDAGEGLDHAGVFSGFHGAE